MTLTYRPATIDDACSLAPRLRPEDLTEVLLCSGRAPEEVLVSSVEMSEVAEAAVVNGSVIAIRGIARAFSMGIPWMLCSPEVTRWSKHMIRDAVHWVAHHGENYSVLVNMVHAENTKAVQWLQHIGFTLGPLYPEWGVGKAPFYQFYRRSTQHV